MIVEDAETGEQLYVDTHDRGFRRGSRPLLRRGRRRSDAFARAGVDAVAVSTDEDLVRAILRMRRTAPGPGPPDVVRVAGDAADAGAPARSALAPRAPLDRRDDGAPPGQGSGGFLTARPARSTVADASPAARPALFVIGLAILLVALARPQSVLSLPRLEGTVILAFDVSGSMAATDLQPTRMEAAKTAAKAFVRAAAGRAS